MKINNLPEKPASTTAVGPAKSLDRSVAPTVAPTTTEGVAVTLSPVTQTMTHGIARSGTDVFDAEKVEAMRSAIENGSFSVNADAIAEKLLSNAREMLSVAAAN